MRKTFDEKTRDLKELIICNYRNWKNGFMSEGAFDMLLKHMNQADLAHLKKMAKLNEKGLTKQKEVLANKKTLYNFGWRIEHVLPLGYVLSQIKNASSEEELAKFFDWYEKNAVCIYIPTSIDGVVNKKYRSTMPSYFDWKDSNCDIYARYTDCGIDISEWV